MSDPAAPGGRLPAVSDPHVGFADNRAVVDALRPAAEGDRPIAAGDLGETAAEVEWALGVPADRFARVVRAPGNHELWTHPQDPVRLRGEERYRYLVGLCRDRGVLTPEDPYPARRGPGGQAAVVPLVLRRPESAQWCGTGLTADRRLRHRPAAVVHGHPHIPRTTWYDGVRFEEVSPGHPRERRRYGFTRDWPVQILPAPEGP